MRGQVFVKKRNEKEKEYMNSLLFSFLGYKKRDLTIKERIDTNKFLL